MQPPAPPFSACRQAPCRCRYFTAGSSYALSVLRGPIGNQHGIEKVGRQTVEPVFGHRSLYRPAAARYRARARFCIMSTFCVDGAVNADAPHTPTQCAALPTLLNRLPLDGNPGVRPIELRLYQRPGLINMPVHMRSRQGRRQAAAGTTLFAGVAAAGCRLLMSARATSLTS